MGHLISKHRKQEDNGGKGEGLSGTCKKDTWTKPKGVGLRVGGGDGGSGRRSGGEMETAVLEQQ